MGPEQKQKHIFLDPFSELLPFLGWSRSLSKLQILVLVRNTAPKGLQKVRRRHFGSLCYWWNIENVQRCPFCILCYCCGPIVSIKQNLTGYIFLFFLLRGGQHIDATGDTHAAMIAEKVHLSNPVLQPR